MFILEGIEFYTKKEVANYVGRSPQTIHLWSKWSDELEERGEERLIPRPYRMGNNYRVWTREDMELIKQFADSITYGELREFSRRQWGEYGKKFQKEDHTV